MSDHYIVISRDWDYLERVAALRPTTALDVQDCWQADIICTAGGCGGWEECREDHTGFDPDDEESMCFDEFEDVLIHGVRHDWRWSFGWTKEFVGCPVQEWASQFDTPDGIDTRRDGRYLLDVDWDDDICYATLVKEVDDE